MLTRPDELTTGRIVPPPGPLTWEPPAPARRQRWAWFAVPALVLVLVLAVSALVTIPYYSISPGMARPVDDLVFVPDDTRFPAEGDVLLTTVSLRKVTLLEAFLGWRDPDVDVYDEEAIFGPVSRDEYREQNVQLMDTSKQDATVVALRRLGYPVPERGDGAIVSDVAPASPAASALTAGDVVVGVDGRTVSLKDDLVAGIQSRRPGEVIEVEIDRGANAARRTAPIRLGELVQSDTTVECRTVAAPAASDGDACIGVLLQTRNRDFDLPFDVRVESAGIGGPSAGLAFSLTLLDVLRPGELTGGRKVAVTGTIDITGAVGPVGGVTQKTAAAISQGATAFLVPPAEFEAAKRRAGRAIDVYSVATLDEAIDVLGRLGGDVAALRPAP